MPNHDLAAIWGGVKDNLRRKLEPGDYDLWIAKTRLLEINEVTARVEAPDDLHAAFLDNNYLSEVQNALEMSLGSRRPVVFESGTASGVLEQPDLFDDELAEEDKGKTAKAPRLRPAVGFLNEQYTFETFVVGANNEFAAAACHAVAKNPAKTYNPLFIFGPTGMGKTHLMHAIGRQILLNRPKARVICVTSEDFTNEFIAAIGSSSLPAFRKKYRQADVLLIDDVQFFGDKGRSQEEFFHTFNTFQDGHKQIVLTCDRMPSEINGLEKRLMSRFEWGMTASVTPPEVETRVAILRRKLQSLKNVPYLSDEVVRFVAEKVRSNVRRLQGAILRVVTYFSLNPELPLSTDIVANKILPDLLHEEAKETVNVDRIQKVVAGHFGMEVSDLTGPRRPADIAWARQLAMYLTRELTKAPYQEVGRAFGNRDHGTVMHACRKVEVLNNVDEKATADLRFLLRELQR
jgi:chromosomal replication initiator protein